MEALVDRYRPRFVIARSPALKRLATTPRFDWKQVAVTRDGSWHELPAPFRNADGSLAGSAVGTPAVD